MANQQHSATAFIPSSSMHHSAFQNGVQEQQGVKSRLSALPGEGFAAGVLKNDNNNARWPQEQQQPMTSRHVNGVGISSEHARQQSHTPYSCSAPGGADSSPQNASWSSSLPSANRLQHHQQRPQQRHLQQQQPSQPLPQQQQQSQGKLLEQQQLAQPHVSQQQQFQQHLSPQQNLQHQAYYHDPSQQRHGGTLGISRQQQQPPRPPWQSNYTSSLESGLSDEIGSSRVSSGSVAPLAPAAATSPFPPHSQPTAAAYSSSNTALGRSELPSNKTLGAGMSCSSPPAIINETLGVHYRSNSAAVSSVPVPSSATTDVWKSPFGATAAVAEGFHHGNASLGRTTSSSSHVSADGQAATTTAAKESIRFSSASQKMSLLTATATGGGGDMQRVVMEAMFSSVRDNLSSEAVIRVSQLQKWFPSLISTLRPYFCVTQTRVRRHVLRLLFPFAALLPPRRGYHQTHAFQSLRDSAAADEDNSSVHAPGDEGGRGTTSHDGSQCKRRENERAVPAKDLYTPLMALITYVLLYALTRADDFQPELLGSTMSVALLLLTAEVLVAKVAMYCVGAPSVHTLDLFSFCGFKYVNLVIILLCRLLLEALTVKDSSTPAGIASPAGTAAALFAASSSSSGTEDGSPAGSPEEIGKDRFSDAVATGENKTTSDVDATREIDSSAAVSDAAAAVAKPAMRALALLSSVRPSFLEKYTWVYMYQLIYVYLCLCAAAEIFVLLRAAAARASQKSAAATAWEGTSSRSSSRAQQYVYSGLALAQIPLCWLLLMPSGGKHKKVA